jgi:hypothetical protein
MRNTKQPVLLYSPILTNTTAVSQPVRKTVVPLVLSAVASHAV